MLKILLCSIAGTSFMTIYSYRQAKRHQEQFEEPVMLSKLVHRIAPEKISAKASIPAGWLIHYSIGVSFNMVYDQIWKNSSLKPGLASGFLLGVPSGIIGMAAWFTALQLHPDPPHTHLRKHLEQLFIAHIIFGISSGLCYRLLEKNNLH
ncbi:hypothetical protein RM553_04425 [Zunongwangia sp. F363]|uniref:DUF1440 domain-containing protein n=1 Tax=Autumnicola tepida TaxID=3075595 RepID=A0ABU3C7L8_9FLAO|nr:hypothetical protein [Zunongwangia sp. F363]MDT0642070.1 hypothetical protein [Zunongwangia sp. F363]